MRACAIGVPILIEELARAEGMRSGAGEGCE
jgi:hypothetical protein